MARGKKDEMMKSHGDMGFVGEKERGVDSYKGKEGGSVDALLTSKDCVPSFIETVRYSMRGGKPLGMDRDDMPKGKQAAQGGPGRKKMAMGGIGKVRKGEY